MTFAIHGSKNGESVVTVRIRPDAAVDKARLLKSVGWQVHITDSAGQQFVVSEFDRFLWINRATTGRSNKLAHRVPRRLDDPNLSDQ
jgi:hypothetical protein